MCNLPATLIRERGVVPCMQATASAPRRGIGRERFPAQSAPEGHGKQACSSTYNGNRQSIRSDRQLEARLKENAAAVATACGVAELRINDTLVTHLPCLPVRVVIPCARDRPQLIFHPRGGGRHDSTPALHWHALLLAPSRTPICRCVFCGHAWHEVCPRRSW